MSPARRKQRTLSDEPIELQDRVRERLRVILPECNDLTWQEMSWITAFCLKYLVMKLDNAQPKES